MRRKQSSRREKQGEMADQAWVARPDALALREVYPPEEFAGFENFGEDPEWHPGEAENKTSSASHTRNKS